MNLRIYPVVLELVRRCAPLLAVLRKRSLVLGDQFERALISIPLNVSEGAYSRGRNRQARYQSACASAASPGRRGARSGRAWFRASRPKRRALIPF